MDPIINNHRDTSEKSQNEKISSDTARPGVPQGQQIGFIPSEKLVDALRFILGPRGQGIHAGTPAGLGLTIIDHNEELDEFGSISFPGNGQVRFNYEYEQILADAKKQTKLEDLVRFIESRLDPRFVGRYLEKRIESAWALGWLVDPNGIHSANFNLESPRQGPQLYNNEQVVELLRRAAQANYSLSATVQLRGIDGGGSGQDLLSFQSRLTQPDQIYPLNLSDLPCTSVIASEFSFSMSVHAADPGFEDKVVFQNGKGGEEIAQLNLKTKFGEEGYAEDVYQQLINESGFISMDRMPAYVLARYYGVTKGVKIVGCPLDPLPSAGGMESSSAYGFLAHAILARICGSQTDLGMAIATDVLDQNKFYGTKSAQKAGGQGDFASCFGASSTVVFLSGLGAKGVDTPEDFVLSNNRYSAFVMPLDLAVKQAELYPQFYLCQPGKEYDHTGKAKVRRRSVDTLEPWEKLWFDTLGIALHGLQRPIHHIWKRSLEEGDLEGAAYALNTCAAIRTLLLSRYEEIYPNDQTHCYMDDAATSLSAAVTEIGGGCMAIGAGGPGSVCLVILPKGYGKEFLESLGFQSYEPEKAAKIMSEGGNLRCYHPFKSSEQPISFSADWEKLEIPSLRTPPLVAVNQETGAVLTLTEFLKNLPGSIPELGPFVHIDGQLSIEEGRKVALAINRTLRSLRKES